ncbi:MAG: ABC transporter ATP-binding protein [Bacteroidota bacterium]|nr:ABC transporter ATP-binding protein [Bacteroidota bacterium]
MTIQLTDAGKRFNRDWIFRHVNFTFHKGRSYAITGPNGSGKSTLLQSIASSMNVSEGNIQYAIDTIKISEENIYQHVSIAAPYLEVIEEMSAKEFLLFHASFKPLLSSVTIDEIIKIIGLEKTADKQIRYFSSGMKQRIKLAQAVFSDANILLLDEPCTNLDATGYALYHQLIKNYCNDKLIIVSSNDENEMDFCEEKISIMDYK